jgi:hypothetical protein
MNGQPFINPGGSAPVYFGGPTAQQPAFPTPLKPARKLQVASGGLYMLNLDFGNCRVDDISGYVGAPAFLPAAPAACWALGASSPWAPPAAAAAAGGRRRLRPCLVLDRASAACRLPLGRLAVASRCAP